jgi:hypothetical protein
LKTASHPCAAGSAELVTFLGVKVALEALKGEGALAELGLTSEDKIRSEARTEVATESAPTAAQEVSP